MNQRWLKWSELGARGAKRDTDKTPKCTCLNWILAHTISGSWNLCNKFWHYQNINPSFRGKAGGRKRFSWGKHSGWRTACLWRSPRSSERSCCLQVFDLRSFICKMICHSHTSSIFMQHHFIVTSRYIGSGGNNSMFSFRMLGYVFAEATINTWKWWR